MEVWFPGRQRTEGSGHLSYVTVLSVTGDMEDEIQIQRGAFDSLSRSLKELSHSYSELPLKKMFFLMKGGVLMDFSLMV